MPPEAPTALIAGDDIHGSRLAHTIARVRAREAAVGAWSWWSEQGARMAARRTEQLVSVASKPLLGLPVGVKDVIDVEGMPTRAGSRAREGSAPARADAEVVARLRAAGAIPVGKTTTTEFAFVDPTATRNPYNSSHSPGGSSSGSAAAVAAGMVPVAIGTQTAGSLCRPAAYCGIAAIKPSYGRLPVAGLAHLSPSFDTIGVMARNVYEADRALSIMAGQPAARTATRKFAGRIARLPDRFYAASSPAVNRFHRQVVARLEHIGLTVREADPKLDFSAVIADHRTVMLFEAHAAHGGLLRDSRALLQPQFRQALEAGAEITPNESAAALERIARSRETIWNAFAEFEAILLQPAPGPAPRGFATTGDQSYLTPWTAFHGPMVTVPGELTDDGLPLATMLAAAPGNDALAVAIADVVQNLVDRLPQEAPFPSDRVSVR